MHFVALLHGGVAIRDALIQLALLEEDCRAVGQEGDVLCITPRESLRCHRARTPVSHAPSCPTRWLCCSGRWRRRTFSPCSTRCPAPSPAAPPSQPCRPLWGLAGGVQSVGYAHTSTSGRCVRTCHLHLGHRLRLSRLGCRVLPAPSGGSVVGVVAGLRPSPDVHSQQNAQHLHHAGVAHVLVERRRRPLHLREHGHKVRLLQVGGRVGVCRDFGKRIRLLEQVAYPSRAGRVGGPALSCLGTLHLRQARLEGLVPGLQVQPPLVACSGLDAAQEQRTSVLGTRARPRLPLPRRCLSRAWSSFPRPNSAAPRRE